MALDFIEQTPSFNPGDTLWEEQGWDNWDEAFLAASHPYPGFMRAPDDAAYQIILSDIYHQYMIKHAAGLVEKLIVLHNFGERLYDFIWHNKLEDFYTDISHNIYTKIKTNYSKAPFLGKCSFYYNRQKNIWLLFSDEDSDKLVEHGWEKTPSLHEIISEVLSPFISQVDGMADFIERSYIEMPRDGELKIALENPNRIKPLSVKEPHKGDKTKTFKDRGHFYNYIINETDEVMPGYTNNPKLKAELDYYFNLIPDDYFKTGKIIKDKQKLIVKISSIRPLRAIATQYNLNK